MPIHGKDNIYDWTERIIEVEIVYGMLKMKIWQVFLFNRLAIVKEPAGSNTEEFHSLGICYILLALVDQLC